MSRKAIQVVAQGKTVIEPDGNGFMIMHPDGSIEAAATKRAAEKKAKAWYQTALGYGSKVGVGTIEWTDYAP